MSNDNGNNGNNNRSKGAAASLLGAAHQQGKLSQRSMAALNVVDLGAQIQAGLGVDVDDVESSEVVLVTMMPDDSSSIRFAGNARAVRDGHNLVLDALASCRQADDIFVHCRYLNGEVLYPYSGIDQAVRMDSGNYNPQQGTPLYDQTVVMLGTVMAKAEEFAHNGVPCRTVSLIITDGGDMHSTRAKASHVRAIVEDMQRAESHVVAAMGIDDGSTDFRRVFREMGIPDAWILTPGSTGSDIRTAFQVFSQSAIRVSQAATLSQTALGGFAN
jgi:hypothetical protein